jgi:hypothetical protein
MLVWWTPRYINVFVDVTVIIWNQLIY